MSASRMGELRIKRVYELPDPEDGVRVLVDRLWPRGLSKDQARVDLWVRGIAPSDSLRQWFGHEATRWEEFIERYFDELRANEPGLAELRELMRGNAVVTLLYAAREPRFNNATALRAYLERD